MKVLALMEDLLKKHTLGKVQTHIYHHDYEIHNSTVDSYPASCQMNKLSFSR